MAGRNWEDIFKTPPASAKAEAAPTQPYASYSEVGADGVVAVRLALVSRQGQHWSYPYGYMGLIDCPTPASLIIHANCGTVDTIQLEGRGLDALLHLLDLQRLTEIRESLQPDYSDAPTLVSKITITFAS